MNEYEKIELEIEHELATLEKFRAEHQDNQDIERYVSDLKHELWQSRL